MKLRSHKSNKSVIIKHKPDIIYYFLSQQEKKIILLVKLK